MEAKMSRADENTYLIIPYINSTNIVDARCVVYQMKGIRQIYKYNWFNAILKLISSYRFNVVTSWVHKKKHK